MKKTFEYYKKIKINDRSDKQNNMISILVRIMIFAINVQAYETYA